MSARDRVQERRRAVALAYHYRDEEGLPIAEIARQLGRAMAYLDDLAVDLASASSHADAWPAGAMQESAAIRAIAGCRPIRLCQHGRIG